MKNNHYSLVPYLWQMIETDSFLSSFQKHTLSDKRNRIGILHEQPPPEYFEATG